MVIVLKKSITADEKKNIADFLGTQNFKTNEIVGEEESILAAVGKLKLKLDPREVEILPGVERVIPISKPYKMASREFKHDDTIVEIPNNRGQVIRVGGQRIIAIAGPCAVESREQMMSIASKVAHSGAVMLRGGAYKPRTSPYSFQGLGEEGLVLLKEAGDAYYGTLQQGKAQVQCRRIHKMVFYRRSPKADDGTRSSDEFKCFNIWHCRRFFFHKRCNRKGFSDLL